MLDHATLYTGAKGDFANEVYKYTLRGIWIPVHKISHNLQLIVCLNYAYILCALRYVGRTLIDGVAIRTLGGECYPDCTCCARSVWRMKRMGAMHY